MSEHDQNTSILRGDNRLTLKEICTNVYNSLISSIKSDSTGTELRTVGQSLLKNACEKNGCFVMYPLIISPNGDINFSTREFTVDLDSVLKIDMAIGRDDDFYYFGKTWSKNPEDKDILKFLSKLVHKIEKRVKADNDIDREAELKRIVGLKEFESDLNFINNDDLGVFIQQECIKNKCKTVENCKSYQYNNNMLFSDDSKYILTNYVKYFDDQDRVIQYNDCMDLEKGERYVINISVIKTDENNINTKYGWNDTPGIGFFNEKVYRLKLKSSREFYSKVKTLKGRNVFLFDEFTTAGDKLGRRECIDNGILEGLHVEFCDKNVYSVKFTICI